MSRTLLTTLISLLAIDNVAHAFTFNFTTPPTQCTNATVKWTDGTAPYKLLLVPTGALHPEVRTIGDYTIESGNSFSFSLKYPGNSTFVAVMSDATGFGTGGTTPIITVAPVHNAVATCIQKSQVAPEFFIFTDPSVPQECAPMTISYSASANPPVDVFLVIPGGASSRIESGSPTNDSFVWTPALHAGTQLLLVGGDTTGAGKGGSTDILTVAAGNSTACLDMQVANATSTIASAPSATRVSSRAMTKSFVSLTLYGATLAVLFLLLQ